MKKTVYQPERTVTGPSYNLWVKLLATLVMVGLLFYGIGIAQRYPLADFSFGLKAGLALALAIVLVTYYWFLRSTITIDAQGIRQTWMYDRHVAWEDVRGAKMIGIPFLYAIFPPRLVVRTSGSFMMFNGGTQEVLIEFAKISLAYQNAPLKT